MQNQKIFSEIQKINDLVSKTFAACGSNIELQSHWAKYICILTAGLMENAIKEVYISYASSQVSTPIAKYISSKLSTIRNPKQQVFLDTAAAFNETWKTNLENYLFDDGRGDALDSVMNNRHLIAHGKSNTSYLSLSQVKTYLNKSIEILEYIETQCKT